MWIRALTSLCGCWVIVCLWRALQAVQRSVGVRRGEKSTLRREHYEHYRQQVANHGFLRSAYMGGAVVYIAALTYVQATSKGQLHAGQITGLVLAYCVAAFVVWSTVMVLVPFWAGMLAEWSHILSLLTFAVYALYCNFAPSLGIMHSVNNMERVLSYNLFWLLEDVPLSTYQSSLGAMTMLHLVSHAGHTPQLLKDPSQLLLTAALYVGLGFVVPQLTHWTVQYALRPSKLPAPIFRTVCMVANVVSVTDLILRIPSLTHPLQDSLRAAAAGDDGMAVLAEVVRWLLPEPGQGQLYVYGLAPALTLSCSTVLLLATLASCVVLTLCEEPVPASEAADHPRHEQDQLVRWLSQIEAMQHLLAFMRTLPMSHRYVLCGILGLGSMQVVGLGALMVGMVLLPSETLLRRVPAILVSVLLGLVLQVAGVAHLVGPPKAQRTALTEPTAPSKPQALTRLQLDTREMTDSHTNDDRGTPWQPSGDSVVTNDLPAAGEGSFGLDGQAVSDQPQEFVARLEALSHYKAFMQGLDAQPDSYTMDDFVNGSANAMKGVFPQVHHSSFCLLNAAGNSVNMYTFLGQGSRQSPRMNVAVAPSTLIYHVLNNCRPVFISNISTFPGPFSDVQFMRFVLGLKSVACLPLVSSQGRVLGVLRLGFQEPWEWTDPEKSIAKQVAFILSSGRNMDGAAAGPMFMPQEQGSPQTEAPLQGPGLGAFEQGDSRRQQGSQSLSHGPPSESQRSQVPVSGASQGGIGGHGGSMNHGISGPGSTLSNSRGQFPGQAPVRSSSTAFDLGSNSHNFIAPSWGTSVPMLNRPMAAGGSSLSMKSGGVHFASPMSSSASQHVGAVLGPPHRGPPHLHTGGVGGFSTMGTVRSTGGGRSVPGWPTAGPGSTSNSVRSGYQHQPSQGGGGGSVASLNPAALGVIEQAAGPPFRSPGHQQDRWEAGSYQSNASGSTVQGGGTGMMRRTGTGRRRPPSSQQMQGGQMDTHSVDPFDEGGPGGVGGEGATSDLKMLEVIGRGGFGSVYKAQWRGRTVAVKVLEHGDEFLGCATDGGSDGPDGNSARGGKESVDRKMDLSGRRAALLEGAMTSTINHPNVVATYDYRVVHLTPQPSKGLGASSRISQETHIVMEWCDKGSLQDAMEKGFFMIDNPAGGKMIDMESLCMTLSEVASAMAYLHTHRITHRDLKPKNVLLKTSQKDRRGFAAKVSDFGLSQVLPDTNRTQVSKNYSGTVTHMPPELIEDGKVYPQGDVYAFGIMMWEAFTGSTPYAHMAHPQIMVAVVTHNLRPRFPDTCPAWYKALAYKCWAKDPKARPTFASVTDVLMAQVRDGAWEAVTSNDDGRS